jgi:hypothetical protein
MLAVRTHQTGSLTEVADYDAYIQDAAKDRYLGAVIVAPNRATGRAHWRVTVYVRALPGDQAGRRFRIGREARVVALSGRLARRFGVES